MLLAVFIIPKLFEENTRYTVFVVNVTKEFTDFTSAKVAACFKLGYENTNVLSVVLR